MAQIPQFNVTSFVDGASAKNGEEVSFTIRINNGVQDQDVMFFLPHDRLPIFISHLVSYGSLARNVRLGRNPFEEADGTYAAGHALNLANAFSGMSVTTPNVALLTLQFDAGNGRKLNSFVAADKEALLKLRAACDDALSKIDVPVAAPKKN